MGIDIIYVNEAESRDRKGKAKRLIKRLVELQKEREKKEDEFYEVKGRKKTSNVK